MHFVGYSDESKCYRLIDPLTNEVIVIRDVICNEYDAWNWESTAKNSLPLLEADSKASFKENDSASPPSLPWSKARSLADIYQSCDFALFSVESACYEDDAMSGAENGNERRDECH